MSLKDKSITYNEIREITSEVVNLQNKLITHGLFQTYHEMHEVTKRIGWEIAEIIEGKHPIKIKQENEDDKN